MRTSFTALSCCLLCLTTGTNAQKSSVPLNLHPAQGKAPDAQTIRLHQQLLAAAETGDIAGVKALLDKGANINVIENYSKTHTPLTYAAEGGDVKMTKFLLAHGADPNGCGVKLSPLFWTVVNGQEECVRLLLRAGADPKRYCVDSNRPIDFAATDGNIFIVNVLIGRMPELSRAQIKKYRAQAGNVLLNVVVTKAPLRDVEAVVAAGAEVNNLDSNDLGGVGSPLMRAARRGSVPIVRFLIRHGANVNLRDSNGRTALMYVGAANLYYSQLTPTLSEDNGDSHRETTRLLLQSSAKVEARDGSGMTPLMFAAMGRPEAVELMLARGAKVSARDSGGRTALHWAATWRDAKSLEILLRHGASVNARDSSGATALMLASVHPDSNKKERATQRGQALGILLRHGTARNLKDNEKRTAADYAKTVDSDYVEGD